jgi:hypothetical protein
MNRHKKWKLNNPEKVLEQQRNWRKNNPDKVKQYQKKARARRAQNLDSNWKTFHSQVKTRNKFGTKNIQIQINFEEFKELKQQNCWYCDQKPQTGYFVGIDRIDSNKHYSIDNCKPCCGICNLMKHTLSMEIFFQKYQQIVDNNNKRTI